MLSATQRILIAKDIHSFSTGLALAIALSLLSVIIFSIPGHAFVMLGSILYITVLIGFYCFIIVTNFFKEQREKNTNFVMTLPITVAQYTVSKVLSSIIIYGIFWFVTFLSLNLAVLITGHLPGFMTSYMCAIFGLMPPALLIILLAAVISNSEGWTITTFVIMNVILTVIITTLPNIPAIQQVFGAGTVREIGIIWHPIISDFIISEMLISLIAMVLLTLFIRNKNEFIHS